MTLSTTPLIFSKESEKLGFYGRETESGNLPAVAIEGISLSGHSAATYDFETSLYHLRARHYSPTLGRFFSRDPIGYTGGSNIMGYCNGDPVNSVDPSGCFAQEFYQTFINQPQQAPSSSILVDTVTRFTSPDAVPTGTGVGIMLQVMRFRNIWEPYGQPLTLPTGQMALRSTKMLTFEIPWKYLWDSNGDPLTCGIQLVFSQVGIGQKVGEKLASFHIRLGRKFRASLFPQESFPPTEPALGRYRPLEPRSLLWGD